MAKPETQTYLSTAYRHLKTHGRWPTARDIERTMQADYLRAARAMQARLGPWFPVDQWNAEVRLPLSALRNSPLVRADLEIFQRTLPLLSVAYRDGRPNPVLASARLRAAGLSDEEIQAVWRIMEVEGSLSEGSRVTGPGEWEFTLSTVVPKVAHARSVDELLALISKPERKWTKLARGWQTAAISKGRNWARTKMAKTLGWILVGTVGSLLATWIWVELVG